MADVRIGTAGLVLGKRDCAVVWLEKDKQSIYLLPKLQDEDTIPEGYLRAALCAVLFSSRPECSAMRSRLQALALVDPEDLPFAGSS